MLRANSRLRTIRKKKERKANSYEKMMKTLLLQNQQIIIQQQNMMFMVIKQLQHPNQSNPASQQSDQAQQNSQQPLPQHQHQQQQQQTPQNQQQQQHHHRTTHQQQQQQQQDNTTQQIQSQHHHQILEQHHAFNTHQLFSHASTISVLDTQQQLQQVESQLQENLGNYLTPAASEQDPINDKSEDDDLSAFLENDGLLQNNLLYHPQTDIGSITPYKSQQQQQQQTPSYYSSGCESLTTPRVEAQKQPSITNISQNVVKNLADSFKSPTKPKINVQILSGTTTGSMKNSKAKIIQRMNISEFLRHVHPDTDEPQKTSTSQ